MDKKNAERRGKNKPNSLIICCQKKSLLCLFICSIKQKTHKYLYIHAYAGVYECVHRYSSNDQKLISWSLHMNTHICMPACMHACMHALNCRKSTCRVHARVSTVCSAQNKALTFLFFLLRPANLIFNPQLAYTNSEVKLISK